MLTKNFKEITSQDVDIAGGKGASLGEMTKAGIPVPPGFVVLSEAFEKFLELTDLNVEIESILSTVDTQKMHTVENASAKIQLLILEAQMPEDILKKIEEDFQKLDAKFVAVRSSATVEDGSEAAWAGQLDSFLNTTEDYLLKNVQKCWASLFTPRAIFYRFEKGLHDTYISVAVVVQKMIQSEKSGIAFSVHPVTEDRNQIIIEAGLGLGEAIVSGSVTPDSYVVNKLKVQSEKLKVEEAIIDVNVNTQIKALFGKDGGGNEWQDIPEPQASSQVLSEEEILELSNLIIKIENHYGFPCDIEWAYEDGKFFITQSRPITTLKSDVLKSIKDKSLDSEEVGLKKADGEAKLLRRIDEQVLEKEMSAFEGNKFDLFIRRRVPYFMDLYRIASYEVKKRWGLGIFFFEAGHKQVKNVWLDRKFNSEAAEIWQKKMDEDPEFINSVTEELESIGKLSKDLAKNISRKNVSMFNNDEFARLVKEHKDYWVKYFSIAYLWFAVDNIATNLQVQIKNKWQGTEDELKKFLSVAFSPSRFPASSREQRELLELKNLSEDDFKNALKKHAEKYAYLAVRDIDDKPFDTKYFEDRINVFEQKGEYEKAKKEFARADKELETASSLIANSDLPKELKKHITFCRDVAYLRTEVIEDLSMVNLAYQKVFLEIAERLNLEIDEVLHMLYEEIVESLKKYKLILSKKEVLDRKTNGYAYLIAPNAAFFVTGEEVDRLQELIIPEDESIKDVKVIKGVCAFEGKVQGKVRIVLDRNEIGKLEKGEILVTAMTTPDFVPAMRISSAIITNEGGILCHAAIMSRELGIPCIIGTKIATQVLQDGDEVEVDADKGVVKIIKRAKADNEDKNILDKIKKYKLAKEIDYPITPVIYFESGHRCYTDNPFFKKLGITNLPAFVSTQIIKYENWMEKNEAIISDKKIISTIVLESFNVIDKYRPEVKKLFEIDYEKAKSQEIIKSLKVIDKILTEIYQVFVFYTGEHFNTSDEKLLNELPEVRMALSNFVSEVQGVSAILLKEVKGQFKDVDSRAFDYATFDEIINLLNNSISKNEFEKFINRPIAYIGLENKLYIIKGDDVQDIQKHFTKEDENLELLEKTTHSIEGSVAYKGIASGNVIKISVDDYGNYDEKLKDKKDFVLVAPMTRPEIVPYLKNAKAIITDEGGITCHAAIVARELQIPCIIGTKIATQVLQDGDEVEVDTSKGVVKIIKKNRR